MKRKKAIHWLDDAKEHHYPAAASYLTLLHDEGKVSELIARLEKASLTQFKAKDIFRASGLSLLGVSNFHVKKVKKLIRKNKPVAPILLVRDKIRSKVVIADGYHRLCAIYQFDEDAWIKCKIV